MKPILLAFSSIAVAASLISCESKQVNDNAPATGETGSSQLIGKTVKVQFDRSALGGGKLVSPTIDSHNGTECSMKGTVIAIDSEWIQLKDVRSRNSTLPEIWIPRENILLLAIDKPKAPAKPKAKANHDSHGHDHGSHDHGSHGGHDHAH